MVLAALVFISGFVTMALEFAASRLLVPVFGSSINTWGVLIGIILAALTVGYHVGGKIADRRPATMQKLGTVIFSAGLYILFIPLAIWPTVESFAVPSSPASLAVSTLILVAPPTVLLGIVSPYAVKLAASTLATLGKKTGNLYSIATIGSIAGTFVTVFALVPVLEINSIMFSLGMALIIPAAIFSLRALPRILAACLAALIIVSTVPVAENGVSFSLPLGSGQDSLNYLGGSLVSGNVVYEAQTPYSSLQVVDSRRPGAAADESSSDIDSPYYKVRSLYLNGDLHSRMYIDRPNELAVTYTKYFPLGMVFNPDAKSVLFVGGGGFSGPKYFAAEYPDMIVDVVEIDPVVIDVAKEHFVVQEDARLKIHNDDGRKFLLTDEEQYDVIVLDAYSTSYVPFHLMTREYYQLLDDRLAPDGVIVSNHIGAMGQLPYNYETSKLWRAAYKTMAEVFPSVQVFSTRPGTDGLQNIMLVAGKEAIDESEIEEKQSTLVEEMRDGVQVDYAASLYDPTKIKTNDVPVFTDQFAPVDTFLSPLDNQPYSIDEEWAVLKNESTDPAGSLANGVTLAMIMIAGVWAIHFLGIWKGAYPTLEK